MTTPLERLETELETFRACVGTWSDHAGKFVLIKGREAVGFYSSYSDAVQDGYARFELEPFLVKRVSAIEHLHFIPPLMREVPNGPLHFSD